MEMIDALKEGWKENPKKVLSVVLLISVWSVLCFIGLSFQYIN